MEQQAIVNNPVYGYYYPLLLRYARRLVKEEAIAASLVTEVLQEQYAIDGLKEHAGLRPQLLLAINYRCHYTVQAKIFDKPLVKAPVLDGKNDRSITDK